MVAHRLTWILAALLVAGSWMAAPVAAQDNQDEQARARFRLGVAHHESGRFAEAATEFKAAYELSGRPQLLYNLFLAYRDGGNTRLAADALRRYLAEANDPPKRQKLEARLAAMERLIARQEAAANEARRQEATSTRTESEVQAEPKPRAPVETVRAEPPVKSVAPVAAPNQLRRYLPWLTVGTGGAMVAGGAVMASLAAKDEAALERDCPMDLCADTDDIARAEAGKKKALAADVMLFGGLAVAGTGLALWFLLPREQQVLDHTSANLSCGPTGCGATLTHRF